MNELHDKRCEILTAFTKVAQEGNLIHPIRILTPTSGASIAILGWTGVSNWRLLAIILAFYFRKSFLGFR